MSIKTFILSNVDSFIKEYTFSRKKKQEIICLFKKSDNSSWYQSQYKLIFSPVIIKQEILFRFNITILLRKNKLFCFLAPMNLFYLNFIVYFFSPEVGRKVTKFFRFDFIGRGFLSFTPWTIWTKATNSISTLRTSRKISMTSSFEENELRVRD